MGQARQHGVDPDRVAAGPAATGVSDHDAVLMRVADDLHRNSTVSDDTWSSLHDNWGLQGAMSAVATAASYRATCMSLNAYAVQFRPGGEISRRLIVRYDHSHRNVKGPTGRLLPRTLPPTIPVQSICSIGSVTPCRRRKSSTAARHPAIAP